MQGPMSEVRSTKPEIGTASDRSRDIAPRTPHPAPRTLCGFTLLELLISMIILALIFIAVLGAIQVGSKSWESGEQRAEENQRNRTLFDTLASELSMLYPLRVQDQDKDVIVFRGKPDSVSFATLPQSYGAAPFSHMIRVVTYSVEGDRGLISTESYPLLGGSGLFGSSAPETGQVKALDERVLETRFRYLVPEGASEDKLPPRWRDSWDPSQDTSTTALKPPVNAPSPLGRPQQRPLKGSDRLPLAVEMTLTIRQTKRHGAQDLILPPLVFPVQVGRTLFEARGDTRAGKAYVGNE